MYAIHPSIAYAQSVVRNMKDKTGRTLEEWLELVIDSGVDGESARRDWLKKTYQLGATSASMIAHRSMGGGLESTDETAYLAAVPRYMEEMFKGKEAFLPAYEAVISYVRAHLPADVKICPCQTIVPLYRNHVFAQVKPATKTRLELGLALKTYTGPLSERLIDTGGLQKGDRITHRFHLAPGEMPDAEMFKWLRKAYEVG